MALILAGIPHMPAPFDARLPVSGHAGLGAAM